MMPTEAGITVDVKKPVRLLRGPVFSMKAGCNDDRCCLAKQGDLPFFKLLLALVATLVTQSIDIDVRRRLGTIQV